MNDDRARYFSAAFLVLIKDGRVLLSQRVNTGHQDGNYSLVAGHLESGETAQQAIVREAFEEASLVIKEADLKVVLVQHTKTESEYFEIFLTTDSWQGEPQNKEPEKCGDLAWFKLDDLPSNTIPYIREALKCIQKGVSYNNFGW